MGIPPFGTRGRKSYGMDGEGVGSYRKCYGEKKKEKGGWDKK
jgi:hypothetical protein